MLLTFSSKGECCKQGDVMHSAPELHWCLTHQTNLQEPENNIFRKLSLIFQLCHRARAQHNRSESLCLLSTTKPPSKGQAGKQHSFKNPD